MIGRRLAMRRMDAAGRYAWSRSRLASHFHAPATNEDKLLVSQLHIAYFANLKHWRIDRSCLFCPNGIPHGLLKGGRPIANSEHDRHAVRAQSNRLHVSVLKLQLGTDGDTARQQQPYPH